MIIFYFVFSLYILFLIIGIYFWNFANISYPNRYTHPSVSIIIAARNEALNISSLLESIEKLSYDRSFLEVIIVDDQSTDNTSDIIQEFSSKSTVNIQLFKQTQYSPTPKKAALTLGIEKSRGEIILFTDADCVLPTRWVKEMTNPFQAQNIELVIGSIKYENGHFLENILSIEQGALLGSGFTSFKLGIPTMCNGANLAIRKSTFYAINGFETKSLVASGDDELLLHKVFLRNKKGICFVNSEQATVITQAADTLKNLYHQRKRWAGKWEKYLLKRTKAFALFIFSFHLIWICYGVSMVFSQFPISIFFFFFLLKVFLEFVFIKSVMHFLGKKINLLGFVLLQFIYSPYVVFFGLIARSKKYTWKGRELN